MWMRLKQIGEQVDGVLPCRLMLTVHKDVEQQLENLVDVPYVQQLIIHIHNIYM